jgi:hypothetical protein
VVRSISTTTESGAEKNPHVSLEQVYKSPKVNAFCALIKERVYSPFFMETTIAGIVYLDVLQQFRIPQLDEDDQEGRIHFQQVGALPHYLGEVCEYLKTHFPGRWIGRAAPIAWPPHSSDLSPLDIFLLGSIKRSSVRTTFACKRHSAPNSNYCGSCRIEARDAT